MKKRLFYFLMVSTMTFSTAYAWEDDVSKNTQVTPNGLTYIDTDIRTSTGGKTFVFILGAGSPVSMRLQVLDAEGNKMLARGGQIISQEPNSSWFGYNQYLEFDKEGNAFVGVQDYRAHPAEQLATYSIYKYTPQGEKLLDGTILNDGKGGKLLSGLSMRACDDGGVICAFNCTSEKDNADFLMVEKLDKDGHSMWIKTLMTTNALSCAFPFLTEAADGRTMVFIAVNGQIKENMIGADGALEWADFKTVYTAGMASPRLWEIMSIDELPGEKTAFSIVDSDRQGRLLVINGDGSIGLDGSDQGVKLNNDPAYSSDKPAVVYHQGDGTFTCVYKIKDDNVSAAYTSFRVQCLNPDGTLAWSAPKELMPFDENVWYGQYMARDAGNGCVALFHLQMNTNNYNDVKGYMNIIGSDGTLDGEPKLFASSAVNKKNLRVSELIGGQFIAAWDEKRTGQISLFMQSIKPQGGSGISVVEADNTGADGKKEYFTLDGVRLLKSRKGFNIVKAGSRAYKIFVK